VKATAYLLTEFNAKFTDNTAVCIDSWVVWLIYTDVHIRYNTIGMHYRSHSRVITLQTAEIPELFPNYPAMPSSNRCKQMSPKIMLFFKSLYEQHLLHYESTLNHVKARLRLGYT